MNLTQKNNLPDTPWHVGYAKKDEDDPKRHRSRCIYNFDGTCHCGKAGCYKFKCGGSAHCLFYEEPALSLDYIYQPDYSKSMTAKEKKELTAHYTELNREENRLILSRESSYLHYLEKISFKEEQESLFSYHILKSSGGEFDKNNRRFLYIWVGYDVGGGDRLTDLICKRGYYLYICKRTTNPFTTLTNAGNRKLLLFETEKHTKINSNKAIEMAIMFARDIVNHYLPEISVEWNNICEPRRLGDCLYFYLDSKYSRTFRTIENCIIGI